MNVGPIILRVAVPSPLRYALDYLPPEENKQTLLPGMRVRVPFQRRFVLGIIIAVTDHSELSSERLRRIDEIIDIEPILPVEVMALATFASQYYHHPIGHVFDAVLPTLLRQGWLNDIQLERQW